MPQYLARRWHMLLYIRFARVNCTHHRDLTPPVHVQCGAKTHCGRDKGVMGLSAKGHLSAAGIVANCLRVESVLAVLALIAAQSFAFQCCSSCFGHETAEGNTGSLTALNTILIRYCQS